MLWIGILLIIMMFSVVVLLYHLYIGLNAYRVGRQTIKRKKRFYLVLTFLSALFAGILIIVNILSFINAEDPSGNVDLAFFIMEITAFVNYIFILYSADKIRKLEKAGGESQ
jgi:uncharacterized membrane protein